MDTQTNQTTNTIRPASTLCTQTGKNYIKWSTHETTQVLLDFVFGNITSSCTTHYYASLVENAKETAKLWSLLGFKAIFLKWVEMLISANMEILNQEPTTEVALFVP